MNEEGMPPELESIPFDILEFISFLGSPQSIWNKHRSIGSTLWGYFVHVIYVLEGIIPSSNR